jgi:hypothetical protein
MASWLNIRVIFAVITMKLVQNLKKKVGRYFLRKEQEVARSRRGSNFNQAQHVGLLYEDVDEPHYKQIKSYVRHLKGEYGIRKILALSFIDTDEKKIPAWHAHKLEFEFFTRSDLNWHLKPGSHVRNFTDTEFDILIDLSSKDCVPIRYVLAHSKAKMKVGRKGNPGEEHYDLVLDLGNELGTDKFLEQVNFYLTNFQIQ